MSFTETEVEDLDADAREVLADLAAFGLAVATGDLAQLGAPFIQLEKESLLLRKLTAEIALRESGTGEAALRRAYEDDPDHRLLVRHLVILSERWRPDSARARARAAAAQALDRVRTGEDFVMVAAEVSEEPGAAGRGGLLQPAREGDWVPEFWEAAAALEEGEVSDVVETRYGFHVLRLEERRAVPYEEARDGILRRFLESPGAVAGAEGWAERQQAAVAVDTAAIDRWRRGLGADTTALAGWPGGRYEAARFAAYKAGLDPGARARLEQAPVGAYADVVAGAARNAMLAERARELGLELTDSEASAAARRWRLRAEAWAASLGVADAQTAAAIKTAAARALASDRQNVYLARLEVAALRPWLRALYPTTLRRTDDAEARGVGGPPGRAERAASRSRAG